MSEPQQELEVRLGPLLAATLLGAGALGCFIYGAARTGMLGSAIEGFSFIGMGWGPVLLVLRHLSNLGLVARGHLSVHPSIEPAQVAGLLLLALAAAGLVLALRRRPAELAEPSPAAQAPLHPRLAQYRDFYWGTLAAYGGGIFAAEAAMVLLQIWLAGDRRGGGGTPAGMLSPVGAFTVSLLVGSGVAFLSGFIGAARAGRMSMPEATVGLLYFGLPLPALLTAITAIPELTLRYGPRLHEVVYVSSLLGRPEAGYWLVFTALVLMMTLGITTGFVVTGSGRADLRVSTELFIAARHVAVFRWRLLLGAFLVLLFGILPPLIIYAVLHAAQAAVERTRIKRLGERDPLEAARAMHVWKQNAQTPTAMMTALSVGGVGVGVMALIIVMSVMSGFEQDLQQKILGTNAHAVVMKYSDDFTEFADTLKQVQSVPGVVGVTPFILNEVMISSEGNIAGSVIKGIDPSTVGQVTDLPRTVEQGGGKLEYLDHPEEILARPLAPHGGAALDERPALDDDILKLPKPAPADSPVLPGIVVGKELAASLRVVVGDRVNVVSPVGGELGPQGPMPKSRPFRVAGIFYSGMYEYDSKMVYIRLAEAQSFFGIKGVTGLELKVADIDDARRIARNVLEALKGYPYRTKDWGEMNKNLFSALRLEKLVMAIILSIIVIVAAGLIVATVIMLVLEKRKEIAVLKALGVSDGGIVKIFLAEGLQIGVAGSLLGLLSGVAWCFLIERVGIKLDPEVYYIPSLPVKVEPLQTALPVVIAILVTFMASVYPALKASRVDPVEGLKAE